VAAGDAHVDAGGERAAVVLASEVADLQILNSNVAAILDLEEADREAVVASRIDALAVDDGVFAREALEGDVAGGRRTGNSDIDLLVVYAFADAHGAAGRGRRGGLLNVAPGLGDCAGVRIVAVGGDVKRAGLGVRESRD
jgi:hypothetical protein